MTRVLSGMQASGAPTIGNYIGAIRHWAEDQHKAESWFFIADLHALTVPVQPGQVGTNTLELVNTMLACGLDPQVCTLFVQSHVPQHTELGWIFACTVSMGELRRMTQFKDKSTDKEFVSAGLFTYPALMAADIVLYDADEVPVGEDQKQHVEVTRDIVQRFNQRFGDVLRVPTPTIPRHGARIKDLQDPTRKMSKSTSAEGGLLYLLEPLSSIEKKIKKSVTDNDGEVRYDRDAKPGVSNLLDLLAAATGDTPQELANKYDQYGSLKTDTAQAVCEMLEPIQQRYAELEKDPTYTKQVLAEGGEKARDVAGATLQRAKDAIGLLAE